MSDIDLDELSLSDLKRLQKDVAKAKALMAEAGLADGFEVTMDHYSNQPYPDLAQAIQANLAEIGIRVKLQAAENRQVLTKMRARQHEMALSSWGTDYFDPNSNGEVFTINKDNSDDAKSKPFLWRSRYKNDDFAAKAEAARDEKDPAKRKEFYDEFQMIVGDDLPIYWINALPYHTVYDKRLGNVPESIWGSMQSMDDVYWKKA